MTAATPRNGACDGRNSVERRIVPVDRELRNDLTLERHGPAGTVGSHERYQAIVIAASAAEPISPFVKGQAGYQGPVDGLGRDFGQSGARLGDAEHSGFEVARRINNAVQTELAARSVDARAADRLAPLERASDQLVRRDLVRQRRYVEQHGASIRVTREPGKPIDQPRFLGASLARVNSGDGRFDRALELALG